MRSPWNSRLNSGYAKKMQTAGNVKGAVLFHGNKYAMDFS